MKSKLRQVATSNSTQAAGGGTALALILIYATGLHRSLPVDAIAPVAIGLTGLLTVVCRTLLALLARIQ